MKLAFIALAIITLFIGGYYFQQYAPILVPFIRSLGWLGPLLFLILYCLATILLLPTMVLTLAGGALFGPVKGILFNLSGATMGAMCAFCISRHLAKDWFIAKRGSKLTKLITGVEQQGWQFVALLRLIPLVPFNLVNYGLGITKIKFSHYVITTVVFLTPCEIIYTYCGYAGLGVLTNPQPLYKSISLIAVLIVSILLVILKCIKYFHSSYLN